MKKILLFAFICLSVNLQAQVAPAILPSDTIPAIINHTEDNGVVKFSPQLRPLRPIAGAPAPFYTYFWEFGDGSFSFEKDPVHTYLDSALTYNVRLYTTNNYDDGKRPPTRPKKIIVKSAKAMLAAVQVPGNLFQPGSSITLKNNCQPKPGDDMMMILGYRNKAGSMTQNLGGTIAILYNDREFSSNNFELSETRTYHNEKSEDLEKLNAFAAMPVKKQKDNLYYASLSPGILQEQIDEILAKEALVLLDQVKNFKSSKAWHFEGLKAGQENFVFMNFKTTPEMIKDTNAIVRLTGVFVPDDPRIEKEIFSVELQIVASHDPNKMSLRKTRMDYRFTGKHRELTYRVDFQNTGKGPAKKVNVGVRISPVFDVTTIKVSRTKPELKSCDSAYANQSCLNVLPGKDSVNFVFNNIYLPGTQQEGVHDADSTKGFVEYKIKFQEKPKKLPIYTRGSIIFDKNEPIVTNRATGRFKPGLSPAIILGFGFPIQTKSNSYLTQKNYTIGASIAPYSPYRKYLQAEIYLSDFKEVSDTKTITANKDTVIGKDRYVISNRSRTLSNKITTINIVPVSLRYSFNDYVGAGVGALLALDINNTSKRDINYMLSGIQGTPDLNLSVLKDKITNAFSDVRASVFADVVVGKVRVGPAIGFRYFYDPKSSVSHASTYVTWKF
ncbi:hypothetical protein EWM62_08715 [Mucilaginibacter terrigena]|uniref:PKD domain-containing protein n=1 Tax=Mucilaginibacter terrigena TaxID=2492395 RepID=A0A4Q5LM19_9SPHI|nr:hypothetical protein [Mucilaginibacter terrigena]RYU90718.1 hypothetical protein EWM62_08715 [Mucilaginibacter terrigena]